MSKKWCSIINLETHKIQLVTTTLSLIDFFQLMKEQHCLLVQYDI